MFAHQVIEDILTLYNMNADRLSDINLRDINLQDMRGFLDPKVQQKAYLEMQKACIKSIQESQKFHLSSVEGISEMGRSMEGKPMFMGDNGGVRLPYKKCWFDYFSDQPDDIPMEKRSTKRGILAFEMSPDIIWSVLFCYMNGYKRWTMEPASYLISVDKPIPNNKMVMEVLKSLAKFVGRTMPDFANSEGNLLLLPLLNIVKEEQFLTLAKEDNEDLSTLNTALMLLSCNNIGTEKVLPPIQLNVKRIKNNKTPMFSYHILIIKPVGKRQESIPQHLWTNRIHLRRGHFKTYTSENPLFGRITGRFWWQAHVAGRNKSGVVLKDYKIKTDFAPSVTQMRST